MAKALIKQSCRAYVTLPLRGSSICSRRLEMVLRSAGKLKCFLLCNGYGPYRIGVSVWAIQYVDKKV